MKKLSIILLIILCSCGHKKKLATWHPTGNVLAIKDTYPHAIYFTSGAVKLIDTFDHITYIIDSSHFFALRVNDKNEILWKTNPWKQYGLGLYRGELTPPAIATVRLYKQPYTLTNAFDVILFQKGEVVLYIQYGDSQFGAIDSSGFFWKLGQD